MKKKVILLFAVCAMGAAGGYMMKNHSDMQVQLSQTLETDDGGSSSVNEDSSEKSDEKKEKDIYVQFSKGKTFYNEDIEVELSFSDKDAVIYYTLDGNDPTESSKKYTSPIKISAKKKAAATTIKAIAVKNGESSPIAVKSYITSTEIDKRFDENTLVFVLSSDEYNLYDYYNGVAVEGYLRDRFLNSSDYNGGEIIPTDPANYNIGGRESERPMYVEVYDSTGDTLISQAAGARVVGGYSRAVGQKSWRLIARNSYSEGNGKFKYPFFGADTDAYGDFIDRYDRITLRNGANDREFAGVRDELSMTLAAQAGFPDTQSVRPAAVFLNSQYYGYSWLHEAYSNDYLEMMYGGNKDNYRIVESRELDASGDDDQTTADWKRVVRLAEKDLTIDLYFNEFCRLVDIDDLMLYYAMQIYIDNKDWPGNNFKAWRYYPAEGEKTDSPYLDGKWRFLFFDAEFAWGLYGNGYRDDTLDNVITGNHMQGSSHILRGLLKREDMQEKFANTLCELMAGAFSPENAVKELDRLIKISDSEQMYALENGYTSEWANKYSFKDSRDQIVSFAQNRPAVVLRSLSKQFGYTGDKYTVSFSNPKGSDTMLGSMKLSAGEKLSVQYFRENSETITAVPYSGYAFDHWEINGKVYNTASVRLSFSMADGNKNIDVRLFMKKTKETGGVCVSELYSSGDGDWIEIYNPTDKAVDLKGWHLSDSKNKLEGWTFPSCEVPAGGVLTVVCKNNKESSSLKRHQTDFSLKTGETLYFTDKELNIVSKITVLDMSKDQSMSLGADGKYHIGVVTEGKHIPG